MYSGSRIQRDLAQGAGAFSVVLSRLRDMNRSFFWVAAFAVPLILLGCSSQYDPKVHPHRLISVTELPDAQAIDLDGNGLDELVHRGKSTTGQKQSVLIRTLDGRAIAQVNFGGTVHDLHFHDLGQDGRLELLVSVRQGDSLFYNVLSADGEKLHRFLAVGGEPRREPGGTITWDIRNSGLQVADVTGTGEPELVSFYRTGFARQPRGVWVHTYPEGRLVGRQPIGALIDLPHTYFGDVDDDSVPEWLFGSTATNNGADAGGMRDARAYLGAIEVTDTPRVQWSREVGETFAAVSMDHGDLDGDGQREFVALPRPREGRQTRRPLYQIDPATGESLQRFVPTTILRELKVGGIGPRGRDRILLLDDSGTLEILDASFNVVRRRTFESDVQNVQILSDLGGDGRSEIVVTTDQGTLWLGSDLSVRAAVERTGTWQVVEMGSGIPPGITIRGPEGKKMTRFRITEHPWWWVYRYGPIAGLVITLAAILGGGILGVRRYHQFQLRQAVHEQVAVHSNREWLLVHPRKGIKMRSADAHTVLGLDRAPITLDRLKHNCPDVYKHLDRLLEVPAGPEREEVEIEGRRLTMTGTPLEITRWGRSYRLVWLEPKTEDVEKYRAQGLMAQRVAHDLKNPLTSILLTLQRMQMAYRKEDSDLAQTLDDYTHRIEDRISSLRRMTTNVLKFMGKEELRRSPTDLGAFLQNLSEELTQNLPPDIEMRQQFADDIPAVSVDQEQLRSVVENLVANAVEAMPEGGVLTLSARLARDLYFDEDAAACDYAVVEVLDTGVGMTATERARLFKPGFSTRDDTGLGMALVRKIMDDHGGYVEVESEVNVGTSVTLYLPVNVDEDSSDVGS